MYQTESDHQKEVEAWKASQPAAKIILKGNVILQEFYAEKILSKHIEEIQALQKRYNRRFYLQEDGDPLHGNKSTSNLCYRLKHDADLQILIHPAQSPDLNPIEACWQLVKQKLRGQKWETVAEFKDAIQRAWDQITIAQIRRRIKEMPWRCKKVQDLDGCRVRSSLW